MILPRVALSIKQPWAWLIAAGHKDIENRTWRTNFRGQFCIHASKTFDMDGYRYVVMYYPEIDMPHPDSFKTGGIVGMARLVGYVKYSQNPWFTGPFGFILQEQRELEFIPMAGKLRFFPIGKLEVNDDTA